MYARTYLQETPCAFLQKIDSLEALYQADEQENLRAMTDETINGEKILQIFIQSQLGL